MKKQIRILLSLCMLVCCAFLLFGTNKSNAAAGTVTSYEKITWGISTGRYGVNGIHAYCAEYSKTWPPVGATIESISLTDNEIIRKALYYGYNGPKNTLGTDARAHVLTAIAISDANIGERETGASAKYDEFYWDLVNNPTEYPTPPSNFKAYIAITTSTSQQDLAFYQIEKNGYVKVLKKSQQEEITKNNSCYSLADARYAIYSSAQLSEDTRVGALVTNKDGESSAMELVPGTYYAKELTAPKGYALSSEVTKFTVSSEKTTVLELTEVPQTNPIDILIQKVDAETKCDEPQGDASLMGAQFTVKFYAGLWEKEVDPATQGQKPMRTWIFQTDERGQVRYKESYKISGDALYTAMPLGTITIQETKSPEGYFRNDTLYVRRVTSQGSAEIVTSYEVPTVEEQVLQVEIRKYQTDTELPIPGTVFELTKADGSKEEFTTDESGKILLKGLTYGKYELREVSVMDGYVRSEEVFTFVVDEVTQENICITVYNDLAPYELVVHKKDDYGNLLSGAEFTLYEDEQCTLEVMKGITDESGLLRMQGLEVGRRYYLKETKAPTGYEMETQVYEVYALNTPVNEEFKFYIDGVEQEMPSDIVGEREGHLEVKNQIAYTLPKTGIFVPYLLQLVGVILCVISICSINTRKKEKGEFKMKKTNILMAALLSITVLFGATVPANAASADVYIAIEKTQMDGVSVTVPSKLPIVFKADGSNLLPTNWEIENISTIAGIQLSRIDMNAEGTGWKLLPESAVISDLKAGTKSIRFFVGEEGAQKMVIPKDNQENSTGSITFEENEIAIPSGGKQLLTFDVERGAFKEDAVSAEAFDMILTFEFI